MKRITWSCRSKIRYRNYLEALIGARKLELSGLARLGKNDLIDIYPCVYCDFIHIGRDRGFKRLKSRLKELERRVENPLYLLKASRTEILRTRDRILGLRLELSNFEERLGG